MKPSSSPVSRIPFLLLALALAFPAAVRAQETEPQIPSAKDLIAKFGGSLPGLVEDGERLFWSDGAELRLPVVDAAEGHPVLATAVGRLAVDKLYFKNGHPETLLSLSSLATRAHEAGLGAPEGAKESVFVFEWSPITRYRLRSDDTIVCEAGVLTRAELDSEPDGAEHVAAVHEAIEAFRADLAASGLTELGRRAVLDFADRLGRSDGDEQIDEVAPSFARRLVRHGWLQGLPGVGAKASTRRLVEAVLAASQDRTLEAYRGEAAELVHFSDAFGDGGWRLTTGETMSYAVRPPLPMYHWIAKDRFAEALVVVDLPAGTDPFSKRDFWTGARSVAMYHDGHRLAVWTPADGLVADEAAWRKVAPAKHPKMLDDHVVEDYLPPHIVLVDPHGDIAAILTSGGPLVPPADGSPEEAERFLGEAADRLPRPADLDLVGQYLFAYVYDSPDPATPFLIGNREVKGDIHQTATQTLETVAGGVCRGDCDDLSELFTTIAGRQGRLAHVINLPAHAAAAFAEEKDGTWHVYVMQTGPTLEFVDAKLAKALEAAYRSFDATDTFDPHGLGVLLRFSGENTRSAWILGWRIFADAEYAALMIDVQKDWHNQTYLQGIEKMKKVLAEGDEDTANLRELASLYRFTGQYALGAEVQKKAIETCAEPESKLYLSIELLDYLDETGQREALQEVVEDLLTNQIPAVGAQVQRGVQIRIGIQLAEALVQAHEYELAAKVMATPAVQSMAQVQQNTIQFFQSPRYNERQWLDSIFLRNLLRDHASASLSVVEKLGPKPLLTDEDYRTMVRDLERYLEMIALRDGDDDADRLFRYSFIGRYGAAMLGEEAFERHLDSVSMPGDAKYDHLARTGGLSQLWADLPWIKASVAYWYGEIAELLGEDRKTVDRARLAYVHGRLREANSAALRLGMQDTQTEYLVHMADVAVSVVLGWDEKLRERLEHVKAKNDRRLRDDTAMWMGDVARFVPIDSYERSIGIWTEVLDYKPKYYWIAWRAALGDAPEHALRVAQVAAERFADDPDFVAEYEFMKSAYSR